MPTLADDNAIRKAAVLIRSLDGEAAAAVLERLSADEARALRDAVRELGEVGDAERRSVAEALRSPAPAPAPAPRAAAEAGGVELAIGQPLAPSSGRPPEPQARPTTPPPPDGHGDKTPVDWLADADPQALVSFLRHEQPQTIAAVLSSLPPAKAAGVLGRLPGEQRPVVLDRLADLGDADPETLDVITSGLKDWIAQRRQRDALRTKRLGAIEAILAETGEGPRAELLKAVGDRPWLHELPSPASLPPVAGQEKETNAAPGHRFGRPVEEDQEPGVPQGPQQGPNAVDSASVGSAAAPTRVAEELPPLVSFAEVERLPAAALAQVMRHAPAEHLLLALAGGSEALTRKIAAALPRRQAADLRQRLTRIGPTRLRDIEHAQLAVARVAGELLRRGWISLAGVSR